MIFPTIHLNGTSKSELVDQLCNASSAVGDALRAVLIQGIESAGYSVSGPTDHRAAENGEPVWVCNARAALARKG